MGRKKARGADTGARENLIEVFGSRDDLPEGFRLLRPQDTAVDMVLERPMAAF